MDTFQLLDTIFVGILWAKKKYKLDNILILAKW